MNFDPIAILEYEAMIFGRHLSMFTGRAGKNPGTLDQSAYILLSLLEAQGPLSIAELTEITELDASTLNRQTKALVEKGFAVRIPDPEGGIARKFRPSPTGFNALREERQATRSKLVELFHDWNEEEIDTFVSLLQKMNRTVERRRGSAWPRPEAE